jgi:hypothetical protein
MWAASPTEPSRSRHLVRIGRLLPFLLLTLATAAALVLTGPGAANPHAAGPQQSGSRMLVCSAAGVKSLARSLVSAINQGRFAAVDQLVARRPAFQWYSVNGAPGRRVGAAADNRRTLITYLRARHRQKEHLYIRRLRFQGAEGGSIGNFNFVATRAALDYGPRTAPGKGAADCTLSQPKVIVWSLGG